MLGIQLSDAHRLRKHLGALVQGDLPTDPVKAARLDQTIKETLQQRSKRSNFDTLGDLILRLGKEGYVLRFNLACSSSLKSLSPVFWRVSIQRLSRMTI
jgi:hypothetical protein